MIRTRRVDWAARYRDLAAKAIPDDADFQAVAAAELVVGDRVVWGGNHILTIETLCRVDDLFLRATCADDPVSPLDLHRRERVLVLVPRPLETDPT